MLTRPPDPPEESGVRSQPVAGGGGGGSAPKAGAKTIAINLSKPDVEMAKRLSRTAACAAGPEARIRNAYMAVFI